MEGPRRKFSKDYKLAAIAPVIEGLKSASEVGRERGINANLVSRWKQEFEAEAGAAFPGNGQQPEQLAELARVKRENERLRGELEILKKAISIFGKGPQ
jgi:transposase